MIITVNGTDQEVADGVTVAEVVERWHPGAVGQRGMAVAIDRRVVPRTQWSDTTISSGARVEFVAAVQGG